MRKSLLTGALCLLLLAFAAPAPAANNGVGTSGASFLRITPMARPAGMGNAYTGLAEGIECLSFNPAGLTTIDKWDVGLSQVIFSRPNENAEINFGLTDLTFSYLALARRLTPKTVMGLEATYFGAKDQVRSAAGTAQGSFTNYDFALGGSVGYQLAPEVALGGTFRFLRSKLSRYNASAVGLDVGVRYQPYQWPGVAIGAAIQNFGTGLKYISSSAPQPLTGRLGVSWTPPKSSFTLAGDVSIDREIQPRGNAGVEWNVTREFYLRSGLDLSYDVTLARAFKFGAGIHSRIGAFDYAYESQGKTGSVHRFSYSYLGGRPQKRADARDTNLYFAADNYIPRFAVAVAVPEFTNISPSPENDWLCQGFREIFASRVKKQPGVVLTDPANARYSLQGRFSAMDGRSYWVGMRIVNVKSGEVVTFKETVISEDDLIGSSTTFAGAVAAAIPAL